MPEYDNTNSGVLFKNDKEGNDSRPDYRGKIDVEGQEFWLSAWLNVSKDGETYMGLKVQPKEVAAGVPDEDIPF